MRKGCVVSLWAAGGIVFSCCGVGALALNGSEFGRLSRNLDKNRERARREKIPTTVEEFSALIPSATPDENAAPFYREAIARLKDDKDLNLISNMRVTPKEGSGAARPPTDDEVDASLARLEPAIALIRRGADKPRLFWDRKWSEGVALLLPEYAQMKGFTKLLVARAKRRTAKGDVAGAISDLRASARVCHQIREEPLLIAGLVRFACEGITIRGLTDSINLRRFDAQLLEGGRKVIDDLGEPTDFGFLMNGEAFFHSSAMDSLDKGNFKDIMTFMGGQDSATPVIGRLFALPMVRSAVRSRLLDIDIEMITSARANRMDPHAWSKMISKVDDQLVANKSVVDKMVGIFEATFDQVGDAGARSMAMRAATRWAIDSLDAARTRGIGSIDQVHPTKAPDDPFVHQPMRFSHKPGLIVFYSVGSNEVDDSGDVFSGEHTPHDVGVGFGNLPKKPLKTTPNPPMPVTPIF